MGGCCSGYSGGVDSALLAVVGRQALGHERFLAVIGRSASYPEAQWRSAVELARRFDVPLLEVDTGELADPRYLGNPTEPLLLLQDRAVDPPGRGRPARGFDTIIDGTNADDLGEHRPGLRAAEEHRVRSPLAELGWSKAAVREASPFARAVRPGTRRRRRVSRAGWSTASRSRPRRLRQVEDGEAYLRGLGVTGDLRVRHHGDRARIEVAPEQMTRRHGRVGRRRPRSSAASASRRSSSIRPATAAADCWRSRRARPPDAAVRRDSDRR